MADIDPVDDIIKKLDELRDQKRPRLQQDCLLDRSMREINTFIHLFPSVSSSNAYITARSCPSVLPVRHDDAEAHEHQCKHGRPLQRLSAFSEKNRGQDHAHNRIHKPEDRDSADRVIL